MLKPRCFLSLLVVTAIAIVSPIATAEEIIVSAAASLTNAFTDVGKAFERRHTDAKVVFNFGASGALLQQIEQGAPVDIFVAADQETMDKAEEKKLIDNETRKDFAGNKLVLIVPRTSTLAVSKLLDLTRPDIKHIAIGNPETVPNGRYARRAIEAAKPGLWEMLGSKFIFANTVRQALDYVVRGEVDAGFVFVTDAMIARDGVKVSMEVPLETPIVYPISIVKDAKNAGLADKFIQFVLSEDGVKILAGYGFLEP